MDRKKIVFSFVVLSILIAITFTFSALSASSKGAPVSQLKTAYQIPSSEGKPFQLAVQSTGTPKIVWFTMTDADAIGELVITDTLDYSVNTYPLAANSAPYDIVFDGSNTVWFTLSGTNRIGRINVNSKALNTVAIPSGNGPRGIDIAPNGTVWFVQTGSNVVTSYVPSGGGFTNYAYPTANARLEETAVLNNNAIWVSAPGAKRISKLTPSSSTFSNVPVQLLPGSATFEPTGMTVDATEPWASGASQGVIGRHAPGTLSFWIWYRLQIGNFAPTKIDYQDGGTSKFIWFIDPTNQFAGRLQTDKNGNLQKFDYTSIVESGALLTDIKVDASDTVWLVDQGTGRIITWNPPYFVYLHLPYIFK